MGVDLYLIDLLENKLKLDFEVEVYKDNYEGEAALVFGETEKENFRASLNYYREPIYIYSKSSNNRINYNTLVGQTIGFLEETNYVYKRTLRDHGIEYDIEHFESVEDVYEAINNDNITSFIDVLKYEHLKKGFYPYKILGTYYSYENKILVNNQYRDLVYLINSVLIEGFEEELEEYNQQEIIFKLRNGFYFTKDEINYIRSSNVNPVIFKNHSSTSNMGVFLDENNNWVGPQADIWKQIKSLTGLNYKILNTRDESIESILDDLGRNGTAQIDASMGIAISEDKKKYIEYLYSGIDLYYSVVGKSNDIHILVDSELYDYKIGLIKDYVNTTKFLDKYPGIKYIDKYNDTDELVKGLINGEVDLIVVENSEYKNLFYNKKMYQLEVKLQLDGGSYITTALAKKSDGFEYLYSISNKALFLIDSFELSKNYLSVTTNLIGLIQQMQRSNDIVALVIILLLISLLIISNSRKQVKENLKKIEDIAYIDKLTGAKNRTFLYNGIEEKKGTVILVNIFSFKKINDIYGYEVGDEVLKTVVKRLFKLEKNFTYKVGKCELFRVSGDEFLIYISNKNIKSYDVIKMAKSIENTINEKMYIKGYSFNIQVSIGIDIENNNDNLNTTMKKAQMALYLAKKNTDTKIVMASEEIYKQYRKKQLLEAELSDDLVIKMVIPFYQPKYNTKTKKIIGVEALARWKHSDMGTLYPDEFIPILENNGKINILDTTVLKKTCKDYMLWKEQGLVDNDFKVSFNFCMLTIEKTNILELFVDLHKEFNIPYNVLEIEVTETVFSSDIESVISKLQSVVKLGVNISLDDFSAGHSTMTQLSNLPINTLKIDKGLLDAGMSKKTKEIFTLIKELTERIDLKIIVEGVETKEQVIFLENIGIYQIQGYYYSRPLSNEDFKIKLKENM